MGEQLGDQVFKDMHAGIDPHVIKERILNYKNQILDNSDLKQEDLEGFLKSANENLLFGYMMAINSHEVKINKDIKVLSSNIKDYNLALREIAKNTNDLVENQRKFFRELDKRFNPDEKDLILSALFDPNIRSAKTDLLAPEQLVFFKNHPDQLQVYKQYLKKNEVNDLMELVAIQETSQKSIAYLKSATQIANNLNLNSQVLSSLNTGAGIASAISSLSSLAITSNPLDALQALSLITGLFSRPKPDPRFTAIFENFKQIQKTLVEIQKQLASINTRIDNIDDGLSIILEQNKNISELIIEQSIKGDDKCNQITNILRNTAKKDLTLLSLTQNFKTERQGDDAKIDACINYLLDTFEGNTFGKEAFLKESLSPDENTSNPEVKKYLITSNQLNTVYTSVYPTVTSLKGAAYFPSNLLSAKRITTHVDNLINNSFLFDITKVNPQTRQWEIVSQGELVDTIKNNKKSQKLIENAIRLVETAIVEQSVIDGTIESKDTVLNFINYKADSCSDIKFNSVACASLINPILANNMIKKSFKELLGYEFYWSWKQIIENNPDFLNEKLQNTNLNIVWVGNGANSLFTGLQLPSRPGYNDGAYVQIKGSTNIYSLPSPDSIKDKIQLASSERTQVLISYKRLLENELIERNIDKILTVDQLNFYNNDKIKLILQ